MKQAVADPHRRVRDPFATSARARGTLPHTPSRHRRLLDCRQRRS